MRITKIEAQVKTKGRYSIYIDDKFSFGLSELALIDSGLRVGAEVNAAQLDQLKQDAQTDKLYNRALGLLARRPRSEWELRDYFKRKSVEPEETEKIISRLQDRGFIDDLDFAQRWIESRRLLKPTSRRKLMLELKQKRVSEATINEALSMDETDELDVLRSEVEKKRRQSRYGDNDKLMQYLARQGYSYDSIKTVLSEDAG